MTPYDSLSHLMTWFKANYISGLKTTITTIKPQFLMTCYNVLWHLMTWFKANYISGFKTTITPIKPQFLMTCYNVLIHWRYFKGRKFCRKKVSWFTKHIHTVKMLHFAVINFCSKVHGILRGNYLSYKYWLIMVDN